MGEARAAAGGVLWTAGGTATVQLLAVASGVLVARTLAPSDYGIAAAALAVLAFAQIFTQLGLGPAIHTGRLVDPVLLRDAHGILLAGGGVLYGLVYLAAPALAAFFAEPRVTMVLRVAALALPLQASMVTPRSSLMQQGRFAAVAFSDVAAQLGAAISAVCLAFSGFGVWALILPALLATTVRLLASWWYCHVSVWPGIRWGRLRAFAAESMHVTIISITDYLFRYADDFIVGRFFGPVGLGRYTFAYNTLAKPLGLFTASLGGVVRTSFGRMAHDPDRIGRAVVRVVRAVARVSFPVLIGGACVARDLVPFLFGAQWTSSVQLVQIFLVLAAVQSIGSFSGSLWLALGRTRALMLYGLLGNAPVVAVFVAGARLGSPEWVAVCFAAYSICVLGPLTVWITQSRFGVPLHGLGRGLLRVLADVGAMAAVVLLAGTALEPGWTRLLVQVVLGAVVYIGLFRGLAVAEMREILAVFPPQIARTAYAVLRLGPLPDESRV